MTKKELTENYTIEELADMIIRKEREIAQIDDILYRNLGIRHTDSQYCDDFNGLLKEKLGQKEHELPSEPIDVASMLINAKCERKRTQFDYALCTFTGQKKEDVPEVIICKKYSKGQLRKIAEHLLVYCDNNEVHEE